ncbi:MULTISPECIES: TetR/AcrR family transcriptional regulator [Methanobacterium]|jgi:AcrR family transcriptional regulator|uniref:TetR/AcrR family transcriptional regulator n=1 Tax=Methanobacterium subterraneum TaxID=59277 RepID=A0A7K4DIY3_9EURY|nr:MULTISPECIES: TetR/AcrR family transcriptional regulator [Methanobacterium]AUB58728.1 TetR family transcriptional regulator [Methanobacterium sp. MZ-A1]MBW4257422.1 TetR/AcrR family transcriptional regulator [Methanobacterium sp. YSL]NMO08290.1 TetR/AcrR family transcriptional regulator [Methanobacterium subterraneum]
MSLTKWKEREKEQRRNDIIKVSRKLFADKDFDKVSMEDIAKEVGLGKGTLYLYFKNKESLYFAVVLKGIQIWAAIVKEEVKKDYSGLNRLISYGNANRGFSNKYPDYFRLLYSPTSIKKQFDMDKMTSSEEFQEVRELFKEIMSVGIDSIQKGIDEGEIRPDVDPTEAAILLSVIYNGKANMGDWAKELLENRGIDEEKFSKDIGDLFLHMLTK